jgi:hypothetical protein
MTRLHILVVVTALGLLVSALPPAHAQSQPAAQDHNDERLRRILLAVAARPLDAAPFLERRISPLYASPMELRGTLSYKPPGTIEKRTTSPIREVLTITAETLTIDPGAGAAPTVVRMDTQGQLSAYVQGLRAILNGDDKLLRQVFDVQLSGSFDAWRLQLLPRGVQPRRGIRQIVVSGAGAQLRQIDTTELNGDQIEMAISVR